MALSFCNFRWCDIRVTPAQAQPRRYALGTVPGHQSPANGAAEMRAWRE